MPVNSIDGRRGVGLLTYTEAATVLTTGNRPFLNPTYGINMNQNGAFGGTPDNVHNGIDNVYWTGSQISGVKVTFNSTDQADAGTNSVKIDNPSLLDTWQFAKGSDLTLSSYVAITFRIYVDKDWSVGDEISIFGWDTGLAAQVGSSVDISDYVSVFSFGEWQSVSIPLSDLGLTSGTIDALRMQNTLVAGGKSPKLYIDTMRIEETGTPIAFTITPPPDQLLNVDSIVLTIADTGTGGTAYAYDKIGAISTLPVGITFAISSAGEPRLTSTVRDIGSIINSGAVVSNVIDDGVNTFITIDIGGANNNPITLSAADSDSMSFTINDDLTGLLRMTAFATGSLEPI